MPIPRRAPRAGPAPIAFPFETPLIATSPRSPPLVLGSIVIVAVVAGLAAECDQYAFTNVSIPLYFSESNRPERLSTTAERIPLESVNVCSSLAMLTDGEAALLVMAENSRHIAIVTIQVRMLSSRRVWLSKNSGWAAHENPRLNPGEPDQTAENRPR